MEVDGVTEEGSGSPGKPKKVKNLELKEYIFYSDYFSGYGAPDRHTETIMYIVRITVSQSPVMVFDVSTHLRPS